MKENTKMKNAQRETTLRPPLRLRCAMVEPLTPIRNCWGYGKIVFFLPLAVSFSFRLSLLGFRPRTLMVRSHLARLRAQLLNRVFPQLTLPSLALFLLIFGGFTSSFCRNSPTLPPDAE